MNTLSTLEKKVTTLVETLVQLKKENKQLQAENVQLAAKLDAMEESLLVDIDRIEKLNQEKVLTKTVVDDLIRSIDLLVEDEKQQ